MVGRGAYPRGHFGAGRQGRGAGRTGGRNGGRAGGGRRHDWSGWGERETQHDAESSQNQIVKQKFPQRQDQAESSHLNSNTQQQNPMPGKKWITKDSERVEEPAAPQMAVRDFPPTTATTVGEHQNTPPAHPLNPREFIAPFCGGAVQGQGFFYFSSTPNENAAREMSACALITVIEGDATARQIEHEFRTWAGAQSTWRWYAKKVNEKQFQMRFPTARKLEEISFFSECKMRTTPATTIKIQKWDSSVGSKGKLEVAWFRVKGIPHEKRTDQNIFYAASCVGIAKEFDKENASKFEYVRIKIACKDVSKVPTVVEVVIDDYLYDIYFQRELPKVGTTNPAGNKWVRNEDHDKPEGDTPSPKKFRKEFESFKAGSAGVSKTQQVRQVHSEPDFKQHLVHSTGQQHPKAGPTAGRFMGDAQKEFTKNIWPSPTPEDFVGRGKEKVTVEEVSDDTTDSDSEGREDIDMGDIGKAAHEVRQPVQNEMNDGAAEKDEDITPPEGQRRHLDDQGEVRLCVLKVTDLKEVALNEYGTNWVNYKYDPLAAIEAKLALKSHSETEKEDMLKELKQNQNSKVLTDEVPAPPTGASPSPPRASQETPPLEGSTLGEQDCSLKYQEMVPVDPPNDPTSFPGLLEQSHQKIRMGPSTENMVRPLEQGLKCRKAGNNSNEVATSTGLQAEEKKQELGAGAEMLQAAALHFHPLQDRQPNLRTRRLAIQGPEEQEAEGGPVALIPANTASGTS